MSENSNLNSAKKSKNDEFYTQYMDIEKELYYYKEHLNNKIIYCNCDNPSWSNFYRYFRVNFFRLGLKKLVSSYYNSVSKSFYSVYDGKEEIIYKLKGNGDFRSNECKELLKEADIVVSNPPFSLFREYISMLMNCKKSFLVIGNINASTCRDIFPLFKENLIWFGVSRVECFITPDKSLQRVGTAYWYSNLDVFSRYIKLNLTKKYDKNKYPKYDDYNAININKLNEIPYDYDGMMGVPVTFLTKYNPNQFSIIGLDRYLDLPNKVYRFHLNDKELYARIVIKKITKYKNLPKE